MFIATAGGHNEGYQDLGDMLEAFLLVVNSVLRWKLSKERIGQDCELPISNIGLHALLVAVYCLRDDPKLMASRLIFTSKCAKVDLRPVEMHWLEKRAQAADPNTDSLLVACTFVDELTLEPDIMNTGTKQAEV